MTYFDKNNLISKRLSQGLISLELGVGHKKRDPASIAIDILDTPQCDVVGNAIEILESLPDSCVQHIYASHFIEHVESPQRLLNSLVRACANGAVISFVAPHFSNPFFYSDPTHNSTYGLYTFCYYSKSSLFQRSIPTYSTIKGLVLADVTLSFSSYRPNYIRHAFKKVVEVIANLSRWSQEFYEEFICWLVPCYEVHYILTVAK